MPTINAIPEAHVNVSALMSHTIHTTTPEASLRETFESMQVYNSSYMIIQDDSGLHGIITERDALNAAASAYRNVDKYLELQAQDLMSSMLITTHHLTPIAEAHALCKANNIHHLCVVDDDDRLCGMVTLSDLCDGLTQLAQYSGNTSLVSTEEQNTDRDNTHQNSIRLGGSIVHLGNQHAMEVDLNYTHASARRYERDYSVAIVALDNMQKFRKQHGDQAVETAMKSIVDILQDNTRQSDRVYHYENERFLMILPETDVDGATIVLSRALSQFRSSTDLPLLRLSVGLTDVHIDDDDSGHIVARAKQYLTQAQNRGGNVLHSDNDQPQGMAHETYKQAPLFM